LAVLTNFNWNYKSIFFNIAAVFGNLKSVHFKSAGKAAFLIPCFH